MLYPRGIPSHAAGSCQVCDMFANVDEWGPPIGGVTVHVRLPHGSSPDTPVIRVQHRSYTCRCTIRTVCLACRARLDEWDDDE